MKFRQWIYRRIASFYIENKYGNSLNRLELLRLLDGSDPGDLLLVESIDRLTRLSSDDWKTLVNSINGSGIGVASLDLSITHLTFGTFPSDDFMCSIQRTGAHRFRFFSCFVLSHLCSLFRASVSL